MTVSLAVGRDARARVTSGIPVQPSTPPHFPLVVSDIGESDPESWPPYVLDQDEDGLPHIVCLDTPIEWDGWRFTEIDQVESEPDRLDARGYPACAAVLRKHAGGVDPEPGRFTTVCGTCGELMEVESGELANDPHPAARTCPMCMLMGGAL